jgi:hypothetical protein
MPSAGHVSKQMLKHYSHIRMEAKRTALESIVRKAAMQRMPRRPPRMTHRCPKIRSILQGSPYSAMRLGVITLRLTAVDQFYSSGHPTSTARDNAVSWLVSLYFVI